MAYPTPIEWTDATWNPIGGCSIKSPGCKPCYAMQLAGTRLHKHPLYAGTTTRENGRPVFNGKMTAAPYYADVWTWPKRWLGAKAPKLGIAADGSRAPSLIFVGDMADLFHEHRTRTIRDKVVRSVAFSRHIGQLLTKRPAEMLDHMIWWRESGSWRPSKLWCGASAERQCEFDERWPALRALAAMGFVVFISYEPALGPLSLPTDFLALGCRAWLIAGGVSGRWPWAPDPDWFRHVRDQCAAAGVPFFFKQWGEWAPDPKIIDAGGPSFKKFPSGWMERKGKGDSGRLLDGREHLEFPQAA